MPKTALKKQLLSAKISQLEEELKNLPDEIFIDDDFYPDSSKRTSAKEFDADFFDIEMEALEGSKKNKDAKALKSDPSLKKTRDYKPQFQSRGRASRGRILVGRARGSRGRVSIYRGGFRPSIKPQKSQDLYNDEEDWSRYVSKSRETEDVSTREREGQPSSSKHDKDIQSSVKNRFVKSFEFSKTIKEFKSKHDDKDMFSFPIDKGESKPSTSNKERTCSPVRKPEKEQINEAGSNKESEVMNLFEELQAKLSSGVVNIPGFDILADTLKKLEKLKDEKGKDKKADDERKNDEKLSKDRKDEMLSDKAGDDTRPTIDIASRLSDQKRDKFGFISKSIPHLPRDKSFEDDLEVIRKPKKYEDKRDSMKESSPTRIVKYSGSWNKEGSPSRKREHSPHRRDEVTTRKRDSLSPVRKRVSSPIRKRGRSPSPAHRRRSPYQRRRTSPSLLHRQRRDSNSPRRRRIESGSPTRRRDSGEYEARKRRESDWYLRRSPKRMRSRSKSRSPRRDHRRRSSSRSPRRWNDKKKELSLSLSPSPVSVHSSQSRGNEHNWFKNKQPDPMQQPEPPGGESSDVCAKVGVKINLKLSQRFCPKLNSL